MPSRTVSQVVLDVLADRPEILGWEDFRVLVGSRQPPWKGGPLPNGWSPENLADATAFILKYNAHTDVNARAKLLKPNKRSADDIGRKLCVDWAAGSYRIWDINKLATQCLKDGGHDPYTIAQEAGFSEVPSSPVLQTSL